MNPLNDGGPAFPIPPAWTGDPRDGMTTGCDGMSLRDWMAFKALAEGQKECAASELAELLGLNCIFDWSLNDVANLMLATPLQWCEAILRAAGKFEESQ